MTILITGASSGIGKVLATLYAQQKQDLILVSRNQEKCAAFGDQLTKEHGIRTHSFAADLSKPNSPKQLYEAITAAKLSVDILINNAGVGSTGEFLDLNIDDEKAMIQLNVTSLVELSYLFGQDMKKKGAGAILNVASTAGFQPGPYMTNYYATKAYVIHFSEGIYKEFKPYGVHVSCLCPGGTKTNFFSTPNMKEVPIGKSFFVLDSMTVAKRAVRGLAQKKPIIITGIMNNLLAFSNRLSPRSLVRTITARLNQ